MFDKLKNLFKKKEQPKQEAPKKREKKVELTEKEKATKDGEPYVNIVKMEVDPNDINSGAFELDWNSIFITQLVKAGYMKKKEDTDQDIVDRWFQDVCRNVALEVYEQQQADPDNRDGLVRKVNRRDIGNGRAEID